DSCASPKYARRGWRVDSRPHPRWGLGGKGVGLELGLKRRTAIVCGASSGMGLATAEALAREGANVSMFARRRDVLDREAERLGHGRIINIASSSVREPADNLALSSSIRPGVIGWAKTMARELGPQKITVNSIAPGRIETARLMEVYAERSRASDMEQIPLRRFGRPEEV